MLVPTTHGLMPKHNPILGTFQHAPSRRDARSKYFTADVVSSAEYELVKELRHNPYTGQFHSGPKQFSRLHGLRRFRSGDDRGTLNITNTMKTEEYQDPKLRTSTMFGSHTDLTLITSSISSDSDQLSESIGSDSGCEDNKEYRRDIAYSEDPSEMVAVFGLGGTEDIVNSIEKSHERLETNRLRSYSSDVIFPASSPNGLSTRPKSMSVTSDFSTGSLGQNQTKQSRFERAKSLPLCVSSPRANGAISLHPMAGLIQSSLRPHPAQRREKRSFRMIESQEKRLVENQESNVLKRSSTSEYGGMVSLPPRRASASSMEQALERSQPRIYDLIRNGQVDLDGETNPFLHGWMSNIAWIVNRTDEITTKYKIDMSKAGSLGKGAYSLAKIAQHKITGAAFAVKIVKKRMLVSEEEKEMVKREVEIHQILQSPRIVRLHEIFEDEKRLFLVMEMAEGGTLEDLIRNNGGRLSEAQCHHTFRQILQAICYLHANGILQGDLKPANILLKPHMSGSDVPIPWSVKLCDFGLSRKVPDVKYYKITGDVHKVPFTGLCGTMGYVAPEILRQEPYGISSDMWSAGIMLFEMLGGIKPFVPYKDCLCVPLHFPNSVFDAVSVGAMDLCKLLLNVDASERIVATDALHHPWVATGLC